MRQGNGSEILGANDPRSAEIGIIHVSPLDDRQSVLAAILTQERLGRKQVVVVLPEDNKAFQRPIDFDGLKNKRRELQAEIIFVAPGGPGPAVLARQRHFPVYSSLENYANSLQDAAAGQNKESKSFAPGWLFSRKQKQDAPSPSTAPTLPVPVTLQPFTPVAMPEATVAQPDRSAKATFATAYPDGFDDEMLSADHDEIEMPAAQNNGTGMHSEDKEEDELPMPPAVPLPYNEPDPAPAASTAQSTAAKADLVSAGNGRGPNIIELSPRRTGTTGKMPIPAAQPDPQPINISKKQGNSDKTAAIGIAGAATAAAGAFSAKKVASNSGTGTGMSAATMAQTASPGSPIPPRGGVRRPGGPAGPGRNIGRNWLIAVGLLLLTLLLVFGGIAYAAPGVFSHFSNIVPGGPISSPATVTITPATKSPPNAYVITAVTGTPSTSDRQVKARILSNNPSQSQTVTATGIKKTPGARATGTLTFYNGSAAPVTVTAGTIFKTGSGIPLTNDIAANIPAANLPNVGTVTVSAHVVNVGISGDVPALALNATCCVTGNFVSVKNLNAFTGGQDPQNYTFLQQSDVDGAANPLEQRLTSSAQANIKGQVHSGEVFVNASNNPISCSSTVTANPPVGSKTQSATVMVQVSCSGEVYDQQGAQALAANLYKSDSTINPGPGFVLTGNVSTSSKVVSVDNKGTVSLLVQAKGTWLYQSSLLVAQEKSWAKQIAGKSKQQALTFLKSQTGVGAATIQFSGNSLPTDPNQITFVIQNVSVSGSPTPSGSSPVPGSPSSGTPTPTPTSQNGLGSSN